MPRLSSRDLNCLRELSHALHTWVEGAPPVLESVLPRMRELLEAQAMVSYGLQIDAGRVRLDFLHTDGLQPGAPRIVAAFFEDAPLNFGHFDALAPEPWQRNVPHTLQELEEGGRLTPPLLQGLYRDLGLAGLHQLRALVCEESTLLGWFGAMRAHPFGARERQLLARLIPELAHRLSRERALRLEALKASALDVALEALPCACYLVSHGGEVLHANAAGLAALARDADGVRQGLRAALDSPGLQAQGYRLTRVEAPGQQPSYVAVQEGNGAEALARVDRMAQRWGLTARQREVLAGLARGHSNRALAQALGCAEKTVEVHVSAVLDKSGAGSRAALLAHLWNS
ncbi:MAG TPA: helix-turn-helix transcriptional regulator [Aggregicoccus sp.]|nr:helix-turn-helix transcriptional regulator [Aggregicoccus sp.]